MTEAFICDCGKDLDDDAWGKLEPVRYEVLRVPCPVHGTDPMIIEVRLCSCGVEVEGEVPIDEIWELVEGFAKTLIESSGTSPSARHLGSGVLALLDALAERLERDHSKKNSADQVKTSACRSSAVH